MAVTITDEKRLLGRIHPLDKLYNHALDQSMYVLPPCLYFNALFFATSSAMGLKQIRIHRETYNRGTKVIIPNFFGISFGGSGLGKNHSFNLAISLFKNMFDRFEELATQFYDSKNENPAMPDRRYVRPSSYFAEVSSSEQGIQKTAQTISDMGHGSVNIFTDELGDNMGIIDPIFKKIKTAWDDGILYGPITASDGGQNYFTVKDMTTNVLLFGSPAAIEFKKEYKDKILQFYITGAMRRGYIYHNTGIKKSGNKNTTFETMTIDDMKQMDTYVKDLQYHINNTEHVLLPHSIFKKLQEYDESKQVEREQLALKSQIAEFLGAPQKIEKLLGILCILDLQTTITEEHLKWAIDFTEIVDATTESTVEYKTNSMLIYEELEKTNGFLARTEIMRRLKGLTLNSFKDEIILTEELASARGNSLITKESSKVLSYKLELLSKSDLNAVNISVNFDPSKNNPAGFAQKTGNFFNIHTIINSESRYSAGSFKDNYINDANYLEDQNLFIVDVDGGMTIEEAKDLFSDWTFLITTTKSHQKEKGKSKIICDRFRIILPTLAAFHLSPEVYSMMYVNVLDTLGVSYDEQCRNCSRWYYGNPTGEHWYNKGDLLDIRSFIPDTREQTAAQKEVENYEKNNYEGSIDARVDGAIRWFLQNTQNGNRGDHMFRFCMLLKDPNRINCPDWENIARHVNTCLTEPLHDSRMNSTIRSASRR